MTAASLLQREGGLYGPVWDRPDPIRTGSVTGLEGDWCALRPRPVDYRPGGGGRSLPHGHGTADPDSSYSSPPSCRPREACFGETTMVSSYPWWRMLADGVCGGGEASFSRAPVLRIVQVVDRVFSGEILVGSAGTDAVPPVGGIFPS